MAALAEAGRPGAASPSPRWSCPCGATLQGLDGVACCPGAALRNPPDRYPIQTAALDTDPARHQAFAATRDDTGRCGHRLDAECGSLHRSDDCTMVLVHATAHSLRAAA